MVYRRLACTIAVLPVLCLLFAALAQTGIADADPGSARSSEAFRELPPTPKLPRIYGRLPGWRVQLLADSSWRPVRDVFHQMSPRLQVPLHLEYHHPWWKLTAGDFTTRAEAAALRHRLTGQGWPDAWIVTATVIVPGPVAAAAPRPEPPVYSHYTIQVAALRDTTALVDFRRRLGEIIILSEAETFQICVGKFNQRSDAAAVLSGIRQQYPEAFIRKTGPKQSNR